MVSSQHGGNVLFMSAFPNMKIKSELLNLKRPLRYGLYPSI